MMMKAFAFAILLFAAIVAWLIGTRIDQETISLLSGTAIGIMVTAPCAALITYIVVKRHDGPNWDKPKPAQNEQWIAPTLQAPTALWPTHTVIVIDQNGRRHLIEGEAVPRLLRGANER